MDKNKLSYLEFIVGVLAEMLGIQVDWASFTMGTNKKQIYNWKKDTDAMKIELVVLHAEKRSGTGLECISKAKHGNSPSTHERVIIQSSKAIGIPAVKIILGVRSWELRFQTCTKWYLSSGG
jgi:hypothetical protein